ncbi:MAG: general transcription repressor [Cirrosporium novae-zelandiae]|nr:MAG: general transcription repressor [Cirrosporium novae-zelandiae]
MYNPHRGMVAAPNNRLTELLDQIRAEFENQSRSGAEYEHTISAQIQEMEMVRRKLFDLEQAQINIKKQYDEEIARLHRELEARGGPPMPSHLGAPGQHPGGPSQPPPPAVGHGQGTLFGGIMAPGGQGGPGLAPPPESQQPPQHPMAQPPPGPGPQQPPQPQQPYQGYQPGPAVNGYASQPPPPSTASPGPGKGLNNRGPPGPPGPQTPQQTQPSYVDATASPHVVRPPTSNEHHPSVPNFGNKLADYDLEALEPFYKKEGADWHAVFNPQYARVLDIDLVHTLAHESVVCCVRFSYDGKFVATGCNFSAQIFDVRTGNKVAILQDDSARTDGGDLYIRSVCFSPDGKYLATGAEDHLIRVWDIASKTIRHTFSGHDQDIYSLDFSMTGRHIASGSGDHTVRLWDIESGRNILQLTIEDGVTTVAVSPDGNYVAAGSLDRSVRVWDAQTGALVERLEGPDGHKDSVYSVAFAPNGREIVSGSLDRTIKMWELSGGSRLVGSSLPPSRGTKCIRTFEGHKDFVLSVALTPDGDWVLSGSKDRGVQFWDPKTGIAHAMLQGHKNSVISVAPSPAGRLFATGSGDMKARIWNYAVFGQRPR